MQVVIVKMVKKIDDDELQCVIGESEGDVSDEAREDQWGLGSSFHRQDAAY